MRRALVLALVPLAAGAFAVADAIGSSSSSSPPAAAPVARAAKVATVKTRHGAHGTYLVDGSGRTLYLFEKDRTARSRCFSACAQGWPPLLTTGRPRAAGGARASLLSTTRRRGGGRQVVYRGHPLYHFVLDKRAGDIRGQGSNAFGAKWYIVAPSGRKIDDD